MMLGATCLEVAVLEVGSVSVSVCGEREAMRIGKKYGGRGRKDTGCTTSPSLESRTSFSISHRNTIYH